MATGTENTSILHDESLVVGGSIGTFRWLDTVSNLREIATTDVASGVIEMLKYDANRLRLFAYASSLRDTSKGSIQIYALPSVSLIYSIEKLDRLSCWSISMRHPYVGIGTNDGYFRLFHLLELKSNSKPQTMTESKAEIEGKEEGGTKNLQFASVGVSDKEISPHPVPSPPVEEHRREVENEGIGDMENSDLDTAFIPGAGAVFEVVLGDNINLNTVETILPLSGNTIHTKKLTCISFCESLACLATSSLDLTVKVWSLDKILLQSVKFDYPILSVCFSPFHEIGDIVITQQTTTLLLKSKVLELILLLDAAILLREDWLEAQRIDNVSDIDVCILTLVGSDSTSSSAKSARVSRLPDLSPANPPSSRESRRSSRDSTASSRPSSISSFSNHWTRAPVVGLKHTPIALNVRRPPHPEMSIYKSERLIKILPPPKAMAIENVNMSNTSEAQNSSLNLLKVERGNTAGENPIQLAEGSSGIVELASTPVPKAPDMSTKPSSAGMRKRVAFRAAS